MAITTLDGWIAAVKQNIIYNKTASITTVGSRWFSMWPSAGEPGAGATNPANTANGVVPTDATLGAPDVRDFAATGYLSGVEFTNVNACNLMLVDRLFHAGAYSFNSNVTLASQPSYSGRVPSGTDFSGTQIWLECVTAFTGNQSIVITYTNQAGTTGRTTGTIATGNAPIVGRMFQMPLQAGDTGVQKIESVISSVATVGTFNVLVLRPLWFGRIQFANDGYNHDFSRTGLPIIFSTSCLQVLVAPDSTVSGTPGLLIKLVDG